MKNIIYFLIPSVIWGSTWLVITYQLGIVDPIISVVYRFTLSAIILFIFCFIKSKNLKYSLQDHFFMFLQGILLFGFNYWCAYFSELYITSGLVAVIFSTLVFFNIFNNAVFLRSKIKPIVLLSALLGFSGIILIFMDEIINFSLTNTSSKGFLIALAGAFIASLGNITSAYNQKRRIPVIQANTYGMLYGAFVMLIIGLTIGKELTFDFSFAYITSLAYLSIFGSIIAFTTYLILLGNIGPDRAGYVTLLFPIIALLLSTIFENYEWSVTSATGIFLVLIGNIIIMRKR